MEENKKHECCGAHNHDKGEGCGCGGHGHGHHHHDDADFDEQIEYITLTLEDGKEHSCAILGTFEVPAIEGKEYMALLPEGTEEVILFSYEVDDEELTLDPVLDEEFEEVSKEFMSLYGEENFDQE